MFKSKIVGVVVQIQDAKKNVLGESVIPIDETSLGNEMSINKNIGDLGPAPTKSRPSKRTDILVKDIENMRSKGMTIASIAKHYGCCDSTIYVTLNGSRKKSKRKRDPITDAEVIEIVEKYKQDMSVNDIAISLNLHITSIHRRLKQAAETDTELRNKLIERSRPRRKDNHGE